MADEDEDDRSEAASEQRLDQAYERGDVPLGRDVVTTVSLGAGLFAVLTLGPALGDSLLRSFALALGQADRPNLLLLPGLLAGPLWRGLAVVAASAAAAVVATLAQTRGGFWPERVVPEVDRLFSLKAVTKPFTRAFLTDLGQAAVKVVAIGASAWLALRGVAGQLPALLQAPLATQVTVLFGALGTLSVRVLAAMAVLAGLDFALARYRFMARLRMTKEEVRREQREEMGDPHVRGRRKRQHRALAKGRAKVEVPRADALVVNPTHIAIAIRYRKEDGRAPRVLAKGKGATAEYMRELARSHGIPIVEDIPLARLLFKRVKVGREVPAETYQAVAAILAFVYKRTPRGLRS
jgi:flagellar biosynthesis protein FlhB